MIYFNNFPQINYSMDKSKDTNLVTNIFNRFAPLETVLKQSLVYYPYFIEDGETPEIVSFKMYDTMDYHWIIMMFNQIHNPYYQWPLSYDQFNSFLEYKYGSMEASTQQIHHYEYIIQQKERLYDGTIIEEKSLIVDEDMFNTLDFSERRIVYNYDYELNLNESKRKIQILDSIFIPQILQEKAIIFNNG
jgi:hypothetical protein